MSKKLIISLMLAFVLSFVSVNALPCADVNFSYSPEQLSVGQNFYFNIKSTNIASPEDPWGDYRQANLTLPSQITTTDSLMVDVSNTPFEDIHDWSAKVVQEGSFTATVKMSNSTGTCELSKSINVVASTNAQGLNFIANQPQTISSQSALVNVTITASESVSNQEITIIKFSSVTNGTLSGKKPAGRYVEVVVQPDLAVRIANASLKVSYLQSEIDSNNINEGTLRLYKYNTATNVWDLLTSTVDTSNNFVEATGLTGFSLFGLFGDENAAPASGGGSSGGGGGGGGGGGSVTRTCTQSDFTCTDYSPCQSSGSQTRTCTKRAGITCTGGVPSTTQSCTFVAPKPVCTPNWECTAFSACSSGSQTRTCTDRNNCGTTQNKPIESQTCTVPISEIIKPNVSGLTGFLVSQPILQYKASAGASTVFVLDDVNHTLTVKQVKSDSVILVIQSDPVEIEVKAGESKSVNIDADPENDITVRINSIENGVVLLTVEKTREVSAGSAAVAVVLLIIVIVLGFMVYKKRSKGEPEEADEPVEFEQPKPPRPRPKARKRIEKQFSDPIDFVQ